MTINVYKNGMELVTNIEAEDFLFEMDDTELEVVLNKLDNCCNKLVSVLFKSDMGDNYLIEKLSELY